MKFLTILTSIFLTLACSEDKFSDTLEKSPTPTGPNRVQDNLNSKIKCVLNENQINTLRAKIVKTWSDFSYDLLESERIDNSQVLIVFSILEALRNTDGLPSLSHSDLKSLIDNIQKTNIEDLESLDNKSKREIFCIL